jgi:hypothetical protein
MTKLCNTCKFRHFIKIDDNRLKHKGRLADGKSVSGFYWFNCDCGSTLVVESQ